MLGGKGKSMAYVSNPHMGKVRRLAVNDVRLGRLSQTQAARKYGVTRSAICKWLKKAHSDHRVFVSTLPSRPHHHPNELSQAVIDRILELRTELHRCAPVIHAHLVMEGQTVSLASVGRVIARYGLARQKHHTRWGTRIPRPLSDHPGALVEIDTMHVVRSDYTRFYIYAVIDTYSRLGFAKYIPHMTQGASVVVIHEAALYFGFPFSVVQSDNGPEFRQGFEFHLSERSMTVRHSRIRTPNDNAHIERFIRTIQDECFDHKYPREESAPRLLKDYLTYYNERRLHLSLGLTTPRQFVSKVLN